MSTVITLPQPIRPNPLASPAYRACLHATEGVYAAVMAAVNVRSPEREPMLQEVVALTRSAYVHVSQTLVHRDAEVSMVAFCSSALLTINGLASLLALPITITTHFESMFSLTGIARELHDRMKHPPTDLDWLAGSRTVDVLVDEVAA